MTDNINSFISTILEKYRDRDFSNIKARDIATLKFFLEKNPTKLYEAFEEQGIDLFVDLQSILSRIDPAIVENAKLILKGESEQGAIIDGIKIIREPVKIDVQELMLEKADKVDKGGALKKRVKGRLYKATFAKGDKPIYIITLATEILHVENDMQIYLRKATDGEILNFFNSEEKTFVTLREVAKEWNLLDDKGYPKDLGGLLEKVTQKQKDEGIFYRLTLPIPKEELRKIKDLSDKIDEALDAGMNKDAKLLYLAKLHIPVVVGDSEVISPALVMQAAPHTLIFTATKPGKTSTIRKIGIVLERPSVANLLGFSTAQDKTEGRLNREIYPIMADGIEEFDDENIARGLLNYMENGQADVARGKGIKTMGYSTLIFSSNPAGGGVDLNFNNGLNLQMLDKLLMTLHSNQLGFGSRTGVFVFDNNMKEADGKGMSFLRERALEKLLKSIQIAAAPVFTQILKNERVNKWISEQDETILNYREKLGKLLTDFDIRGYGRILEFIQGHMRAFRHIKGAAIRAAYIESIGEMLEIEENERVSDTYISLILERAKTHLKNIIAINLESFSELSNTLKKEDITVQIYEGRYDSIRARGNRYELLLLECAASWYANNEKIVEDMIGNGKNPAIFLSSLKEQFMKIPTEKRRASAYDTFNKLVNVIESNLQKINRHRQWLGFYLEKRDGSTLVKFTAEKSWFEWLYKIVTVTDTTEITVKHSLTFGKNGKNGVGNESLYSQNGEEIPDFANLVEQVMATKPAYKWHYTEIAEALDYSNSEYVYERLKEITASPSNTTRIRSASGGYYVLVEKVK